LPQQPFLPSPIAFEPLPLRARAGLASDSAIGPDAETARLGKLQAAGRQRRQEVMSPLLTR